MNLMLERIQELWLVHKSIGDFLVFPFPLEGAEQPVPDDQGSGIVLVQAVAIGACLKEKKKEKKSVLWCSILV